MKTDILNGLNTRLNNKHALEYFMGITENTEKFVDTVKKNKQKDVFLVQFLCLKDKDADVPPYWTEIREYGDFKYFLAFLSFIFLNKSLVTRLAQKAYGNLQGAFFYKKPEGKEETVFKSILNYCISHSLFMSEVKNTGVPYNFSDALNLPDVGVLVSHMLRDRFSSVDSKIATLSDKDFYQLCIDNGVSKALGLDDDIFVRWMSGADRGNYVKSLNVSNFYCVENAELNFGNSKEIYLLGENGDGKTLLLDALFLAFNGNRLHRMDSSEVGLAVDMLKNAPTGPLFNVTGTDDKGAKYSPAYKAKLKNFFAYGTHRGRCGGLEEKAGEKNGFMTLFDTEKKLVHPSEWIVKVCVDDVVASGSTQNYDENASKTFDSKLALLQKVFNTILDKEIKVFIDKEDKNRVKYNEDGAKLTFEVLSEGYRSVIIFVCDLLYRLYDQNIGNITEQGFDATGVVLIDEIDSHLHPRWQRTIVGRLRKLFQNMQFIMTTHSTHIIQGATDDAVIFRVYREDGKTAVSRPYYRKDLDYMMINTLATSPLFGLDDARLRKDDNIIDTTHDYIVYKIESKVREELSKMKLSDHFTEEKIDELVAKAYSEVKKNK